MQPETHTLEWAELGDRSNSSLVIPILQKPKPDNFLKAQQRGAFKKLSVVDASRIDINSTTVEWESQVWLIEGMNL
ncbi:hypothetical protein [Vacuolonema iberomarrocanum]|uniref:hypothetical protein n=1 Tax=Vacuolonema iberomarrocanum TaxID=3454632 RepID=UPI0019F43DFD|nr:hypothetical protein [filamentous cyanobacterium LEGE 07170]